MNTLCEPILLEADVKPTPNRLIVLNALYEANAPMSLVELETALETLDRSSILRVLTLLLERGVIHTLEDGRGIAKYEICHAHHSANHDDMHVHFYCEQCRRTFCFEEVLAPRVTTPVGFVAHSLNYMLKGICPDCAKKFANKFA